MRENLAYPAEVAERRDDSEDELHHDDVRPNVVDDSGSCWGSPPLPVDDRVWFHPSEAARQADAAAPAALRSTKRRLAALGAALVGATIIGVGTTAVFAHADTAKPAPWQPAVIVPAWLGLSVTMTTKAKSTPEDEDAWAHHPCMVVQVAKQSPAWNAGVRPSDRIVRIDDEELLDAERFVYAISSHQPGDEIEIAIERNNQFALLHATLTTLPSYNDSSSENSGG